MDFSKPAERGAFILGFSSDATWVRIYETRYGNEVKNACKQPAYEKCLFVVQAYNDSNQGLLAHAPTV